MYVQAKNIKQTYLWEIESKALSRAEGERETSVFAACKGVRERDKAWRHESEQGALPSLRRVLD